MPDEPQAAPDGPAYELIDTIGDYRIVLSRVSGRIFMAWYDPATRQTRNRAISEPPHRERAMPPLPAGAP